MGRNGGTLFGDPRDRGRRVLVRAIGDQPGHVEETQTKDIRASWEA